MRLYLRNMRRLPLAELRQRLLLFVIIYVVWGTTFCTVITAFATWLEWHARWTITASNALLALFAIVSLVRFRVTKRTDLIEHMVIPQALCVAVVNQYAMPRLAQMQYIPLVGVVLPVLIELPTRTIRASHLLAVISALFYSLVYGLDLRLFGYYRPPVHQPWHLIMSLLAGALAPISFVGFVCMLHYSILDSRKRAAEATKDLEERQRRLRAEQRLSRRLLHSILPEDVASVCIDRLRKEAEAERETTALSLTKKMEWADLRPLDPNTRNKSSLRRHTSPQR
eukprot:TRINITY_DN2830_c2_g1_i1.p1 TRINITY_DN2830_c2_g1~~TRINITY_DN2830_c2_g1_i1.p1  ORF type:complete len:283 (+),score=43.71 TRINITY_DN2830_c2_g1_i1:27-875(+)